jgi:cytochrome b6-f complex iron-sulfur subunit
MHIPKYTRREFCAQSYQTLSLAAVASILTGCGSPTSATSTLPAAPTIAANIVNNTITLAIDGGSPLVTPGNAALVNASGRAFLVARTSASAFTALTAICTHEQCTVSNYQNQVYECPCHGSQYSVSGSVIKGPAPSSLRTFPTTFAGTTLTITTT